MSVAALRRTSVTFLADTDEAAVVEQIEGNQERCLYVLFFPDTLAEQADAAESTGELHPCEHSLSLLDYYCSNPKSSFVYLHQHAASMVGQVVRTAAERGTPLRE